MVIFRVKVFSRGAGGKFQWMREGHVERTEVARYLPDLRGYAPRECIIIIVYRWSELFE